MSKKQQISTIVPMSSPDITDREREAVAAVMHRPILSMGQEIRAFEQAAMELTGSRHAIGVSSGTAGLHLCIRAANIKPGDMVVTTPFSFVASANVILFEGGVPIFVDVDPVTGNINPQLIKEVIQDLYDDSARAKHWFPRRGLPNIRNVKAILPVDVFGQPADMDPIIEVGKEYNLKVIEDSCEALGAMYKSRHAGTLGDYGVFAFYPNKQITTGEGAMIITNDDDGAALMRALRNQGRSPGDTWLQHTHLGYNYRLDEMSAALGRIQISRLNELLEKRQIVAGWYIERLDNIPGIEIPQVTVKTTRMSWFVYVVRFAAGIDRDWVANKLAQSGIPARPYFIPIHLQPYMVERFGYREGDYPITEDLGRRGLALPFSGVMSESQVELVCQKLRQIL